MKVKFVDSKENHHEQSCVSFQTVGKSTFQYIFVFTGRIMAYLCNYSKL